MQSVKTLISAERIRQRVAELGARIAQDYQDRPLTVVGVLTGSLVFLADLTRQLAVPHRIGVLQASSYRGRATVPDELRINAELVPDLRNRHVLLLDDILDTGRTLAALLNKIRRLHPLTVEICVLLRKRGRQIEEFEPRYCGFDIPDVFVVGYGLDYNDDFRHLPYVAELSSA